MDKTDLFITFYCPFIQNGYLKECGMKQYGRQHARKLIVDFDKRRVSCKAYHQKGKKSSTKQVMVALASEKMRIYIEQNNIEPVEDI